MKKFIFAKGANEVTVKESFERTQKHAMDVLKESNAFFLISLKHGDDPRSVDVGAILNGTHPVHILAILDKIRELEEDLKVLAEKALKSM